MKNIFIILIVSLCAVQSIVAQDVLITTDGEVMSVYIDDIGSSTIYYKSVNSENSSLQRIDKAKVYMIKKADGTKIDLSGTSTPTQPATNPAAQPMNTELSEEAKQRNQELIDALNKAATVPENVFPEDDKISGVFATLGVGNNSIICNDDIEISYYTETYQAYYTEDNMITFCIKNKTNKLVFIDLQNTFFTSEGESSSYYIPTAYSSSTSKTGDANAGTFAGAMGIHDYQTNVSTNTVYSQRVISIAPNSQKKLDRKWMFPTHSHLVCPGLYFQYYMYGKKYRGQLIFHLGDKKSPNAYLRRGETFSFDQGNSPVKFTFFATYSFNENCEVTNSISIELFMKKVIGYWINVIVDIPDYENTGFLMGSTVTKYYDRSHIEQMFGGTVFKRP